MWRSCTLKTPFVPHAPAGMASVVGDVIAFRLTLVYVSVLAALFAVPDAEAAV
jgi:hypothetical protein